MSERRQRLLATYKAQRPRMPDALREQFPTVQEYLDLEGIAWIRQEGEEADDVMATLAANASREGADVRLVTSDKDLCQLVDERVRVVPPGELDREMDADGVLEKMGVSPARVVERLALTGDTVDNIEGVPGVGPKTATRLLDQYDGIANLLARLDEVEPERIREAIRTHRDRVRLNLELVVLKRDLELPVTWTSMTARAENPDRVLPFLRRMEFGSLVREFEKEVAKSPLLGIDTGIRPV